jgi:transcriptional regulator GlxA family with amidase domain
MDRDYTQRLTIDDLARRARMSKFHFIRAFKVETGQTPHQYLRALRIERAKHLLETTPAPVTDICEQIGFESLGSFSALFRRLTGESPAAYRAAHRRQIYIPSCFLRMYRANPAE